MSLPVHAQEVGLGIAKTPFSSTTTDTSARTSRAKTSLVSVQWTTSDVAALSYPLYAPGDPHCCPTGGSRLVRFEWNGSAVVPLDPLPPDPQTARLVRLGQHWATPGNTGNTGQVPQHRRIGQHE